MKVPLVLVVSILICGLNALIVPDEVPTILSVIFSNIPTIKKGTDSRIGWGFRLGDRADFQVLTELGPQIYTQPLANQGEKEGNSKRNSLDTLASRLYAQRQQEKKIQQKKKSEAAESNNKDVGKNDGGKWLQEWSETVVKSQENEALPLKPRPGIGIGEIDAKSVIPEDSVLEQQKSFRNQQISSTIQKPIKRQTPPAIVKKVEVPKEKPLDDVSLE